METVERPMLRVREAAALLGISRTTLYRLIRTNQVPVRRYAGAIRIPRWWVEQQVEDAR